MTLFVLNNDTLICEDCFELNELPETAPDVDPGLWSMGNVKQGECSNCGRIVSPDGEPA